MVVIGIVLMLLVFVSGCHFFEGLEAPVEYDDGHDADYDKAYGYVDALKVQTA